MICGPATTFTYWKASIEAKLMQAEVDMVYMDFKRAFDSVSHDGLLQNFMLLV